MYVFSKYYIRTFYFCFGYNFVAAKDRCPLARNPWMSTTPGSYIQIWSFHYLLLSWGLSWKQFIIFQRIRIHIKKWWVRILSVTGLFCQDKTEHHDNESGSKLFPVVFFFKEKTRRQQIRQVITDLRVLCLDTMITIKTSTYYRHSFF